MTNVENPANNAHKNTNSNWAVSLKIKVKMNKIKNSKEITNWKY